jgi:hypothetical protein
VEHQYRVKPEEDARSEGILDSQGAAQGRLAALGIDLEYKGREKCRLPTETEPRKWGKTH